MENVTEIVPFLQQIISCKKKFAINVTNVENEITVSILKGNRWKRFTNKNPSIIMTDIRQSFHLA